MRGDGVGGLCRWRLPIGNWSTGIGWIEIQLDFASKFPQFGQYLSQFWSHIAHFIPGALVEIASINNVTRHYLLQIPSQFAGMYLSHLLADLISIFYEIPWLHCNVMCLPNKTLSTTIYLKRVKRKARLTKCFQAGHQIAKISMRTSSYSFQPGIRRLLCLKAV